MTSELQPNFGFFDGLELQEVREGPLDLGEIAAHLGLHDLTERGDRRIISRMEHPRLELNQDSGGLHLHFIAMPDPGGPGVDFFEGTDRLRVQYEVWRDATAGIKTVVGSVTIISPTGMILSLQDHNPALFNVAVLRK